MNEHQRVARFALGANLGFGRMHCRRCGDETLHRAQKCIHCGTPYEAAPPKPLPRLSCKEVMAAESEAKRQRRRSA